VHLKSYLHILKIILTTQLTISQSEGQLELGVGAGLLDVVARDGDRVELGHLNGGVSGGRRESSKGETKHKHTNTRDENHSFYKCKT
jgi:hypothetical protein